MAYGKFLTRNRHGTRWVFRISIPRDIRPQLDNRKELRQSLATYDKAAANALARRLRVAAEDIFQEVRHGMGDGKDLEYYRQRLLIEQGRQRSGAGKLKDRLRDSEQNADIAANKARRWRATLDAERQDFHSTLRELSRVSSSAQTELPDEACTFSQVADFYQKSRDAENFKKDRGHGVVALWKEFFRGKHCHEIKASDIARAMDLVNNMPKHATAKRTARQVIELCEQNHGMELLHKGTRQRYQRPLRDILKLARKRGHMREDLSTLIEVDSGKPGKRGPALGTTKVMPFSNADMALLFPGADYGFLPAASWAKPKTLPAKFWIPLILSFTGARRTEICQLLVSDIKRHETGALYFDINETDEGGGEDPSGKSVKNINSVRQVPVHSTLLRIGIEDFIEERRTAEGESAMLFPWPMTLTTGPSAFSKWFSRDEEHNGRRVLGYLERSGMENRGKGWRKTLHSLRHTVATNLGNGGLPVAEVASILGHLGESDVDLLSRLFNRNLATDGYILRESPRMELLQRVVESIQYPGIDFDFDSISWSTFRARHGL